ncbi:hypothetical protein [Acinetobacter sp. MD2]|uniref:hypothetical protein n=1 Tax=Acinetobacter sp. MD2 TaxID=2600066 RepID=UPI002D1F4F38|nr:hypothetical protein [Acinetobacter sp. MD2]MEB3768036.1 hypothetical protein [Acinetobacter sp. MD2]
MKKLLSTLILGLSATAFAATAMAAPTAEKQPAPEKHHIAPKPTEHHQVAQQHKPAPQKHAVKHDVKKPHQVKKHAKKPLPPKHQPEHIAPKKA